MVLPDWFPTVTSVGAGISLFAFFAWETVNAWREARR